MPGAGEVPGAMGRLDDHAKRRIVELRRAGLSFRKIKKVLELDDIRVTPQAVYLFLKRKSVEPGPAAAGWDGDQPWPPLRGHEAEPPGAQPPAMPGGVPAGSQAPCPAGSQDTKEGIRIVSVASLCKDSEQLGENLPMGLTPGNGKAWLPMWGVATMATPWQRWARERAPRPLLGASKGLLSRRFSLCPLQAMMAPQVSPWLQGAAPLRGCQPPSRSPCPAQGGWLHPPPGTQP